MANQKIKTSTSLRAMLKVGQRSFRMAPGLAILKIADSVLLAILPIVTTYFAAKTTSALAGAYAGDDTAAKDVFTYVIITAVLGVLLILWRSVSNFISQKIRYVVESAIEDEMTLKFTSLDFASYDDKKVVDLHEKAERFSYMFSYIFDTVGSLLSGLVGAIAAVVALMIMSPILGLIVFVAIIPNMIIQLKLSRQQAKHWESNLTNRRRKGNIGWMLRESRFIAEMRIYGVVKHLIDIYADLRDKDIKVRMEFELKTGWKVMMFDIGTALVELGALMWVTLEIINRHQPVGQFVYVQQMVSRAFSEASSLAGQLGGMDEDLANVSHYQEFMELVSTDDTGRDIRTMADGIDIEHVSFKYPDTDVTVLDDVSIAIPKGARVAIVGENGAGKSTLIKIIMGLYAPTSGRVMVDGQDMADIKKESWHRQISLLGQDFVQYIFATMRENITLGDVRKRPTDELIYEAMDRAEFTKVANKQPHGMDTFIERWMADDDAPDTATELSGGQAQRLAMARNFYRDAPVMILDEPTSAIDALAESRIFKRLFSDKTGKTLIIVSHRLTTIERSDVIYMMEQGRVVESGTHAELVAKKGAYYHMFESQITK